MPCSEQKRVLVFLPTLNDSTHLHRLVNEVHSLGEQYQALVIDDGSTPPLDSGLLPDRTMVANLPDNYGLGLCTHIAFDHALRNKYAGGVVRIDSDGQHPTDLIPKMIAPLEAGEADVVLGRRLNHAEGTGLRPLVSGFAKRYIRVLTRLLVGSSAPEDMNSGLLAFNAEAMLALNTCNLERYPEPQIVCLAIGFGLRVKTVDVLQEARTEGDSSIGTLQGLQIMYRFTIFALGEFLQRRPRQ